MAPRKSAKRKRSDQNEQDPQIENHFKDIMDGCTYEWVDPHDCVPFTMTRPISKSGVLKLMDLFDAAYDGESINGGGISCGTDTPILAKLDGSLLVHVGEYFRKKGLPESKVKDRLNSRKQWYGIVDGEHSHSAIMRLIETKKRWSGYKWFVTMVKGGFNIERYRQLARMQNERHSNRFHVEMTFFDMVSNMRTEYDKLCKVSSRVIGQDIVNAYCGYTINSKKNSTLVQTANTVARLPISVIHAIGEISNAEHPDLLLANSRLNNRGASTVDEAMRQMDCRVFRNFLHITSLKSAKAFMNAKHANGEKAQVYTIYRVQDLYRQRCFTRAIQPDELGRQYELSLYSIEEEEKFLNFISPDEWPEEMATMRENLLKTVQLSDDVLLNHGNKDLLPCLLTAYKRHLPGRYIVKQQRFDTLHKREEAATIKPGTNGATNEDSAIESPTSDGSPETDLLNSNKRTSIETSNEKNEEKVSEGGGSNSRNQEKEENSIDAKIKQLKEKGLNCFNMKWQEFSKEVWSVNDKRIDAIITEPPSTPSLSFIQKLNKRKETQDSVNDEITSTDIMDIIKSGKRFLKPGGYFIVLIAFDMFQEWYLSFKACGFNVMRRPLTFCYKNEAVPRRPSEESDFPYGLEEDCVVARLPGSHPDGFNPNFQSRFNLIECSSLRRAPIVTNVDLPKNKLCYPNTRKPVRVSEKPINILAEIIDLFVPSYGTTMDLFSGTLTLPIAALKTSRRCIALEKDQRCFELAIDRLTNFCRPVFKFISNHQSLTESQNMSTLTVDESSTATKNTISPCPSSETGKISISGASEKRTILTNSSEDTSKDMDEVLCTDPYGERNKPISEQKEAKKISISTEESEPPLKTFKTIKDLEAGHSLLLLTNRSTANR